MKEAIKLNYIFCFFLIFFVFSFLYKTDQAFDQDLGRHLKLGEIIFQTHQIPKVNLFSYTYPNFPFINTHYLFEVMVFQIQKILSLEDLLILKIIVILASAVITLVSVASMTKSLEKTLFLPISFIFFHLFRERLDLRPEIFSFLFTSLTLFILIKFKKDNSKLIYFLPAIQLIWVNMHIYFFIGLLLQLIFLFDLKRIRTSALILILSTLFCLINPNFIDGLLFPLRVSSNYGYTIVENQTIFFLERINFSDPNFLFYKLAALIIILSLVAGFRKRTLSLVNILLSIAGLTLATLNVRSFPYLILISLAPTVTNFGYFSKRPIIVLNLIVLIFLITESIFYLNGSYYKLTDSDSSVNLDFDQHIKGAMDFVLTKKLSGPIYNNFDVGSYIIYRGYPKLRVSVDGRPEAYPKDFFQNIYIASQLDENNFKQLDEIHNLQTIIFSITDQTDWGRHFLGQIVKNKDWSTVYLDNFMIVLVKTDKLAHLNIRPVDLMKLTPGQYNYQDHVSYLRMALFLLNIGQPTESLAFTQKALSIFPSSPLANLLMWNLLGQTSGEFYQKSQKTIWW